MSTLKTGLLCWNFLVKVNQISTKSIQYEIPSHCRVVQGWNWELLSSSNCSVNITLNFTPISYFIDFLMNLILFVGIQICSICFLILPTVQYQLLQEWRYLEAFFWHSKSPFKWVCRPPFFRSALSCKVQVSHLIIWYQKSNSCSLEG